MKKKLKIMIIEDLLYDVSITYTNEEKQRSVALLPNLKINGERNLKTCIKSIIFFQYWSLPVW